MQKLKQSRLASFIIVTLVYVIATVGGIAIYNLINLPWWLSLLIADVFATIITFLFSIIFNNASVYDPYWSVQPPIILIAFAIGKNLTALGVLLIIAISYWAIRLTANWAYTFSNLTHQDWRYTMLNEKTGAFYPIVNFIGIHLVPTLIVYGCILPAVYAIINNLTANGFSVIFICVSLLATTLQGVADIQMQKFRKSACGGFIRVGLWKYSRHPNYLGEILMWWGIGLSVTFSAVNCWYLLLGAFLNTILFLLVSIPMADKRQSKKQGFDDYKAQTRMLLPIKKFTKI